MSPGEWIALAAMFLTPALAVSGAGIAIYGRLVKVETKLEALFEMIETKQR